jgi:hypothetical protein
MATAGILSPVRAVEAASTGGAEDIPAFGGSRACLAVWA